MRHCYLRCRRRWPRRGRTWRGGEGASGNLRGTCTAPARHQRLIPCRALRPAARQQSTKRSSRVRRSLVLPRVAPWCSGPPGGAQSRCRTRRTTAMTLAQSGRPGPELAPHGLSASDRGGNSARQRLAGVAAAWAVIELRRAVHSTPVHSTPVQRDTVPGHGDTIARASRRVLTRAAGPQASYSSSAWRAAPSRATLGLRMT
jgi:hypothetical protein